MNTANRFGDMSIQARAKRYERRRGSLPHTPDGDDAIPIRRRAPVADIPRADEKRRGGEYRVREAAKRAQAQAQARGMGATATAEGSPRTQRGRTIPQDKRRFRPDPDSTHNTDAILEDQRNSDAARLAHSGRIRYQGRLRAMIAVLVLLCIVFASIPVYLWIFVIRHVQVEGNTAYSAEEIVAASDVSMGDNLYSFSSRTAGETLTLRCPYIHSLEVSRSIPDTVRFIVREDSAVFACEIYGEWWALSGTMRVLAPVSAEEAASLISLRLPPVASAIGGRVLCLEDERLSRRIRSCIENVLHSAVGARITHVDLRDVSEPILICDRMYRLQLGGTEDMAVKLRVAHAVLSDPIFDGTIKAELDLRENGATSVVFDDQLDFGF